MKINIRSYQKGGGVRTSIYQPVLTTPTFNPAQYAIGLLDGTTTASAGKTSANNGSITEKDLYTGLYKTIAEQGLQSDTQVIINQLQEELFTDQLLDPLGGTQNLAAKYLKALNYVNQAKQNQELYKQTYNLAVAKNSLAETAITSNGKVVVRTKDQKLDTITPEEYRENPNNYQLLTNGNLLAERMNNPQLAFQNGILETVQNGTSVKEVMDTIQLFINGLGNNEDTLTGYTRKETQQIQGGLALLNVAAQKYGSEQVADMIQENGLYKIGITSEDQIKQVQMALMAINQALPENQKTLLKIKTDGTEKGMAAMISLLVNKNSSSKFTFTPELQHEKDGSSSSSGSGGEGLDKLKLGPEEQYYLGLGNKQDIPFQNGTQYAFTARNAVSRQLTTPEGKPTGVTTGDALTKSSYSNQFYTGSITLGGQVISPEALHNLVIDGTITSAVLPVDVKAKNEQNILKPDFEHLKKLEEADKKVRDAGIDTSIIALAQVKIQNGQQLSETEKKLLQETIDKINAIYRDSGLSQVYDSSGNLTAQYHRFTMVNAKAPESVFKAGTNWKATGLQEITNSGDIDNILDVINKERGEKNKIDFDKRGWLGVDNFWFLDYDRMFEGTMFIPMKESFIDAYTDTLNPGQVNTIDAHEQFNVRLQGGFKE